MKRLITAEEVRAEGMDLRLLELPDVASEARRVLAEAAAEARRIVEEARRRADDVFREASRRGLEEGLARGREEGAAEGRQSARQEAGQRLSADLAELTALARKVVGELSAARDDLLRQARAEMLDFAIELARKIVGQAARADPEAARANLQKVLELADARGNVRILVHPAQLEMLQGHAAELVEALRFRGRVSLAGDERIERGGVRLLSRQGEIDATIRTQLDNVVEALRGGPPGQDPSEPEGSPASDGPEPAGPGGPPPAGSEGGRSV